jgi:hypothetical protein
MLEVINLIEIIIIIKDLLFYNIIQEIININIIFYRDYYNFINFIKDIIIFFNLILESFIKELYIYNIYYSYEIFTEFSEYLPIIDKIKGSDLTYIDLRRNNNTTNIEEKVDKTKKNNDDEEEEEDRELTVLENLFIIFLVEIFVFHVFG